MKKIVNEWRGYLREGQTGTAFEDVVVAVARGDNPGEKGSIEYKGTPFTELAVQSLAKMGLKPGSDKSAKKHAAKGISGDPKTDIIINGLNISLKLPGQIQFASGEAKSSSVAMKLALEEYLDQRPKDLMNEAERQIAEELELSISKFIDSLAETVGKRYLPRGKSGEGYILQLKAKAEKDWDSNKYASGTQIPSKVKKQGPPQQVFPERIDYVKFFVGKAMRQAWTSEKTATPSWEQFSANVMAGLKENVKNLATVNKSYYNIIIDEFLTGRRQFASSPENIATHLLSPDGFYDISTPQATAKQISKWQPFIKFDVRGKGRDYLSKAVTVRVGFFADKYYKSLEGAVGKLIDSSSQIEESEQEKKTKVGFLAQTVADQVKFDFDRNKKVQPEI